MIESSLMIGFRGQQRPEEAIFFGMEAVNCYQQIRKNIYGLDKDLQTGFAQSKSATYRELAELLVESDRLGEAEQVLDLLKEQELKEVVRGAAGNPEAKVEPLKLNAIQQKAQSELTTAEKTAVALTDLSIEYSGLQAKVTRTPEEDARLKTLEASIEKENGEVSDFFRKTLYPSGCECFIEQREVGGQPVAKYAGGTGTARDGHTAAAGRRTCVCDCCNGAGAQEVRVEGNAGRVAQQGVAGAQRSARAHVRP